MKKWVLILLAFTSARQLSAQALELSLSSKGDLLNNAFYYGGGGIYHQLKVPKGMHLQVENFKQHVELSRINDTLYKVRLRGFEFGQCDSLQLQIKYQNKTFSRAYAVVLFRPDMIFRLGFLQDQDKCTVAELESNLQKGVSVYLRFNNAWLGKQMREYYAIRITRYECVFYSGEEKVAEEAVAGSGGFGPKWAEIRNKFKIDRIVITSIRGSGPAGEVRLLPVEIFIKG